MPLPDRYRHEVAEMAALWEPAGYFAAQARIWRAQCEVRAALTGQPSPGDLDTIHQALELSPADVVELSRAEGHETNKLLRLVQSRLAPELGNLIHRGNTSSDVLDTSLALQMVAGLDLLEADFADLADVLGALAIEHRETIQIARTHGQHAVPQTFGRQVAGWFAEIERCRERFDRARFVISVGKLAGEVGTHIFISREHEEATLAQLGLRPDPAPTQVISRDRHAEVAVLLAVNAGSLDRIATAIALLGITDVGEVREPFDAASQQGSSAMPHKRNTELCERVRGLARRVRGAAGEQLEAMSLWLERDISHSSTERFTLPDAYGALAYMARLLARVLSALYVDSNRMASNVDATFGSVYAARLLNELLDAGAMTRTEGYEIVKGLSQKALDEHTALLELALADSSITDHLSKETITACFDPNLALGNIGVAFDRLGLRDD